MQWITGAPRAVWAGEGRCVFLLVFEPPLCHLHSHSSPNLGNSEDLYSHSRSQEIHLAQSNVMWTYQLHFIVHPYCIASKTTANSLPSVTFMTSSSRLGKKVIFGKSPTRTSSPHWLQADANPEHNRMYPLTISLSGRGIACVMLESLRNTVQPTQLKGAHIFKQELGSLLLTSLHDNAIVSYFLKVSWT